MRLFPRIRAGWPVVLLSAGCLILAGGLGCETNSGVSSDDPPGGSGDFFLTPRSVVLGFEDDRATFSATGGDEPLTWGISDEDLGSLTDTEGRIANYNRKGDAEGVNEITVKDAIGRVARAAITQDNEITGGAPRINPVRSRIVEVDGTVSLTANGGNPPYRWSVSDTSLGSLSNSAEPAVNYRRNGVTVGVNTVFVKDSADKSSSATIEQIEVDVPDPAKLRVSPSSAQLTQPSQIVTLIGAGGVPPYQWKVVDSSLGSLSNTDQSAVNYQRNGATVGTNAVELRDSQGSLVLVPIIQP